MDWNGCDLVESTSGASIVKGTRISADALLGKLQAQMRWGEIAGNFPDVSSNLIEAVLIYASERLAWDDETLVDWQGCSIVERVPGRCSGAYTVVGTRVFPDIIIHCSDADNSVEEIHQDYPSVSRQAIRELIAFAHLQRLRLAL